MPQAAPSFGQPRPINRLGGAGTQAIPGLFPTWRLTLGGGGWRLPGLTGSPAHPVGRLILGLGYLWEAAHRRGGRLARDVLCHEPAALRVLRELLQGGACMGFQLRRRSGSKWLRGGVGAEVKAEARLAARPATHETGAAVVAVASMGARVIVAAATTLLRVHLVTARAPRNHGLRAGRQWRRALCSDVANPWEVWGGNAAPFRKLPELRTQKCSKL